ncbi:hypothetical protein GCM10027051_08030 [Niabella terrae]
MAAQNVTSPYSTLGLGDISTQSTGRYSISGVSVSRRNENTYNDGNPASLSSLGLKSVNFDLTGKGRSSRFPSKAIDTASAFSKDFVVHNVSMAFKPFHATGFALGLKPYSTVNYQYPLPDAIYNDQTQGFSRQVEGSGGINQIYGSLGHAWSKNFSVGITAAYLFGSTQKMTSYLDNNLGLDISKNEISFYSGGKFDFGLQYYTDANRSWQHTWGLTFTANTRLKGYRKTEYTSSDTIFGEKSNGPAHFKLPISGLLGYTASNKRGLSISVEGGYYNWEKQSLNYTNSYTSPNFHIAAGWEYARTVKSYLEGFTYEKYYLGMGLIAENSYFHLNGNKIWDYGFTLGGGYNVTGRLYLHGGLELGRRGSFSSAQIKENYTQFTLGISVKNIWYKFGTQ